MAKGEGWAEAFVEVKETGDLEADQAAQRVEPPCLEVLRLVLPGPAVEFSATCWGGASATRVQRLRRALPGVRPV